MLSRELLSKAVRTGFMESLIRKAPMQNGTGFQRIVMEAVNAAPITAWKRVTSQLY